MRNFIVLGASALVLALGVAQASAAGSARPANADLIGQTYATASVQPEASRFQALEPADVTATQIHHAGR